MAKPLLPDELWERLQRWQALGVWDRLRERGPPRSRRWNTSWAWERRA
jgi:hypothetical protein